MGLVADVVDGRSRGGSGAGDGAADPSNSPFGTWMTKETMWQTIDAPSLRQALDIENRTQIMCAATGDVAEARAAFVAKRPPVWKGL